MKKIRVAGRSYDRQGKRQYCLYVGNRAIKTSIHKQPLVMLGQLLKDNKISIEEIKAIKILDAHHIYHLFRKSYSTELKSARQVRKQISKRMIAKLPIADNKELKKNIRPTPNAIRINPYLVISKDGFSNGKQIYQIHYWNTKIKTSINKDWLIEMATMLDNEQISVEEIKSFKNAKEFEHWKRKKNPIIY